MTHPTPNPLDTTKDLLRSSLPTHSTDAAPTPPDDLLSDLGERFKNRPATVSTRPNPFDRILTIFSSPFVGVTAALLLTLALALSISKNPNSSVQEVFRGYSERSAITLVLLHAKTHQHEAIEKDKTLEFKAIVNTTDPLEAAQVATAKILIDFRGNKIIAYNSESREVFADDLESDPSKRAQQLRGASKRLQ